MNERRTDVVRKVAGFAMLAVILVMPAARAAAQTNSAADESQIARVTAGLLTRSHLNATNESADLSSRFFNQFLDMLDPTRLYFLETDVAEFASNRTDLAASLLQSGDASPAHRIFRVFQQRLDQRVAYVRDELARAPYTFADNDTYTPERSKAPRPADLDAAHRLWRDQLRFEVLQEKLNGAAPTGIVAALTGRYDRVQKTMRSIKPDQVFELYMNALAHVYDPHSDYMGRRTLDDFTITMQLSLFGIGAQLRFEDGYTKIAELIPGGPAAASKQIEPGDRILAVAQDGKQAVDCVEMPVNDVVQMIRGPRATRVTLTLQPTSGVNGGQRKTVTLVRDEIKLENQEAKARVQDVPSKDGKNIRIGIIDLPSFYVASGSNSIAKAGCAAHVARLLAKLNQEHVDGLIIDLRRNGGGSLEDAVRMCGLFIASGTMVEVKGHVVNNVQVKNVVTTYLRDPDPSIQYSGPLVVLTSRISASASEIFAGAMQDYGRGLIVGDPSTFGKGTVQTMVALAPILQQQGIQTSENPGALKLTIQQFYRPGGSSTQLKGVASDIVLPSPLTVAKIGEAQFPTCLPWDSIPPVGVTVLDAVAPYVQALKEKSDRRIAESREFVWLREDIERARKFMEHPVVSLNEKMRAQEKAEAAAREEARRKVRASRKEPAVTQYEITVANADKPGLPTPLASAATNAYSVALAEPVPTLGISTTDTTGRRDAAAPDVTLEETKRILMDYVELWKASPPRFAVPPLQTNSYVERAP